MHGQTMGDRLTAGDASAVKYFTPSVCALSLCRTTASETTAWTSRRPEIPSLAVFAFGTTFFKRRYSSTFERRRQASVGQ